MKIKQLKKVDREEFIIDSSKDKSILHLGCADWPMTERKLEAESLLHSRILSANPNAIGADASVEGCAALEKAGLKNIVCIDPKNLLSEYFDQKFDVIIAGEIIEHLFDFTKFFDSLRSVSHEQTKLVITTPNYANVKKLPALLWSEEVIHPDHTCYFSQATLSKVLKDCGWEPRNWHSYWFSRRTSSKIYNTLLSGLGFMQVYADGIVVEATPAPRSHS